MIERRPKLYYSVPLRRVELDGGKVFFAIDTRDLAPLAHRQHKHLLAAVRAVLQRDGFAGGEIIARRFVGKNGKMLTRYLLTERGIDRVMEHLKNRMGLDKAALIVRLRVAFDRAVHGFVDPPLVEPAPDSEIRPPEVETALDLDPPPPAPPPEAGRVLRDFVDRKAAEAAPKVDIALQKQINGVVLFLCSPAVKAPPTVLGPLCQWNAMRLEEALPHLRSWSDLNELYAS